MIRFLNAHFPLRTVFLGLSEACLIALAFAGAVIVRLGPHDAAWMMSYQGGYAKIVAVLVAFMFCMNYFDLYDTAVLSNLVEVLIRWVQVLGTVCIVMALIYYLYPPLGLGRGIFAIALPFGTVTLLLWRCLFLRVNILPQFTERAVILGDCPIAELLAMAIRSRPEFGIRIVGHLKGFENSNGSHATISSEEHIAGLLMSIKGYKPHRVIVAFRERRGNLPLDALLQLKDRGVKIQEGVGLYEAITGKVHIDTLRMSDLLFSPNHRSFWLLLVYKRVLSIVLSVIGLVLFLPLMFLVAMAVRLDSAGPVIFRQRRVGKNGELFTLYKFRTMADCADKDGDHRPAEIADYRFTRCGRFLRRAHIDELPQLWNILRGDMTFVGPRPFVPNQEKECAKHIPYYSRRWVVRPGATGWAQVNRGYNATIDENREKLAYDLFYIKNCSIGLDMLILFKTLKIMLLGRGSR